MPNSLGGSNWPNSERDEAARLADNLSPQQRSFCMSRIKGKDTELERLLRSDLHNKGLRFKKHTTTLPGRPDVVFVTERVAVFVDGDFWHGYRLRCWESRLSPFWQKKIQRNRIRDTNTHRRLRRAGWVVIRIWGHDIQRNRAAVVQRIAAVVERRRQEFARR